MAKQQSLAEQAGVLSKDVGLPAVFTAPQQKIESMAVNPYIAFAHPKRADEWTKLVNTFGQNDVREADMFLITSKRLVKGPLKVTGLCFKQFWAEVNATGEVLRTSLKEQPRPWKEHIEGVLLVYLEDTIVPANVTFRSTKCPGGKILADALIEAGTPNWGAKSAQHKETLVCAQPFMRFYGELSVGPNRTSRSSGNSYRPCQCNIKPTGVSEWRLLNSFFNDEASKEAMTLAANRYQDRLADMTKKLIAG